MGCWRIRPGSGFVLCAMLVLVMSVGCSRRRPPAFDLSALVAGGQHEEPMPTVAEARAAPRVLVLPLADRAAPARVGRMHNALDDLFRRDLLCLPHLSVFSSGELPISIEALYTAEYRTLETALRAGRHVGATHVLIGEVATRDQQIAIEVDLVDIRAQKVAQTLRLQEIERRLDKAIATLRTQVVALFASDLPALDAEVPGHTPPHKVLERCGFAEDQAALGDYSQAILDYYAAAKVKAKYAGAFVGIADTQLQLGAPHVAEAAYKTALGFDPDGVETYWRYGLMRIREQVGPRRDALALVQQASFRAPLFGPAHLTLGTLWFEAKKYDHADKHFRIAAELLPRSVWPHYNHAQIQRVRGDLAGARAALERAAALGPRVATVQVELGLLLRELGEQEGALERFRVAADVQPQNSLYLFYVGEQYERLGDPETALAAYRAAAAYPFTHDSLHRQLGEAFIRAGQLEEAEGVLAAGYADGVRDPEHILLFARVLLERGRKNPIRRRDFATRAGNMLEHLLQVPLSEAHRTRATELAGIAEVMKTR